jgi:hypothetical protein
MASIELKSPNDGSLLSFTVIQESAYEIEFWVEVQNQNFNGRARTSTYHSGSPGLLFNEMAQNWRGWKGHKQWQDLESRVTLSAKSDSTGHIFLTVELLNSDHTSQIKVTLQYEAGQLENMAEAVSSLLG